MYTIKKKKVIALEIMMKNRISTIKYIAKENNLSIPKILDIMAENDKYGCETTIRKVLEDGSESIRFRYNTIEDIYESLIIKFGEDFAADDIDALKHIIREKSKIIYGLKREVALYEELKTIYERLIDGMEKQIINKDDMIKKLLNRLLEKE
jgi:hypothetical protein